MQVPGELKKKTVVADHDDEDDHPRRRDYDDDLPLVRYRDDEDDDRPLPVRRLRRRGRVCECPNCGAEDVPVERKEMAQEGLIVLIVLLFVFWPLFWIGLLMKQTFLICRECGFKIRKEGGMTFG